MAFQKKHDGSLRLCINYRPLNIDCAQYLSYSTDCGFVDQLSNTKYFTKLHLRSGYYQVQIADWDEPKTTCVTRYGIFKFLVIPFRLTNAPMKFCRLMNQVFHNYLDVVVVVYLDNFVVYSTLNEEHKRHLAKLFQKLRDNQLFVKREKCQFAKERIKFLGHMMDRGYIQMDLEKVKGIQNYVLSLDQPINIRDLLRAIQEG